MMKVLSIYSYKVCSLSLYISAHHVQLIIFHSMDSSRATGIQACIYITYKEDAHWLISLLHGI